MTCFVKTEIHQFFSQFVSNHPRWSGMSNSLFEEACEWDYFKKSLVCIFPWQTKAMYSENEKLTLIFSLCFNISIYNLELHKYANYGMIEEQ